MLLAVVAASLPLAVAPGSAPAAQTSGPRPTGDPQAVPDGKPSDEPETTISFDLATVSDYRFRGFTQSDGKPALQATTEAASPAGFYAGAWGSTIAAYYGARIELDLYGGYRARVAGIDLDAGVVSYFYPGADGASSAEFYASGAREIGDATVKLGASYTPEQAELGDGDGLYLFAEAEKPLPGLPVVVRGHVGRETGVNTVAGGQKLDWLLGADLEHGPATFSVAWVDARYRGRKAEEHHRGRAVASVSFGF